MLCWFAKVWFHYPALHPCVFTKSLILWKYLGGDKVKVIKSQLILVFEVPQSKLMRNGHLIIDIFDTRKNFFNWCYFDIEPQRSVFNQRKFYGRALHSLVEAVRSQSRYELFESVNLKSQRILPLFRRDLTGSLIFIIIRINIHVHWYSKINQIFNTKLDFGRIIDCFRVTILDKAKSVGLNLTQKQHKKYWNTGHP